MLNNLTYQDYGDGSVRCRLCGNVLDEEEQQFFVECKKCTEYLGEIEGNFIRKEEHAEDNSNGQRPFHLNTGSRKFSLDCDN